MELQRLRHEISNPRLNATNPYMNEIAALYAARPTATKAFDQLLAYYDHLLTTLPPLEKEEAERERAAIFREKICL